jgi:hypothetical protein
MMPHKEWGRINMAKTFCSSRFLLIPPDSLPGIVVGYRAKPESVARLREIVVRNPGLSHVQFEWAAMTADGQIEILPH